jgi:hypothetical protein
VTTAAPMRSSFVTLLLLLMLMELMLLGSGRLLQFGPLTARMYFYLGGLGCATLVVLFRGTVHREVLLLALGFVALTTISALIGLVNQAQPSDVVDDVKPLLFFLNLLFFDVAITDLRQVNRIATLVRACSIILAAAYLLGIALVLAGVIPIGTALKVLSQSDEFFLRGGTGVFYKSFLYLGIGFCFFLVGQRRSSLLAALLFATIVLTLTRGMVLAAVVIVGIAALLHPRGGLRLPAYLIGLASAGLVALPWLVTMFASRSEADELRQGDFHSVVESATWTSLLVGHGLGADVGGRARIEESYLEILHQQGLLGLFFWAAVAALLARDFMAASRAGRRDAAIPFFLGALFVYVESATNPFLTNPIGMSMVLVSLVVLRVLCRLPPEHTPAPGKALVLAA